VSIQFQAVNWNRQKFWYDGAALGAVALFLAVYAAADTLLHPEFTIETVLIRGLGIVAFGLLNLVLAIGPLARLDRRFLPLLYNRRHLGVLMCLLGLGHATFAVIQFHAGGDQPALVSLLTGSGNVRDLGRFPFELLGLAGLAILVLMAATSHDFWLAVLGPETWKALHMAVYVAYALLVGHLALGVLQQERHPGLAALLGLGMVTVFGLHLAAGRREVGLDRRAARPAGEGWLDVCGVDDVAEGRARAVMLERERVAVVRHGGAISVVSNVCRHQGGPLGEGRVVDGCLTCPWHGYQYRPDDGCSPPPYLERLPTYRVRIAAGRVLVDPRANPAGTLVEPARIMATGHGGSP
jgi:nitrite reductase/ring-hydroxylating ferredoxin subunit/DMSO/TMAO reductase YedYZ heme-binding membrane subunit